MKVLQLLKDLKLRKKALNQGDRRLKERKNKLFFSIFCLFVLHGQCVYKNLSKNANITSWLVKIYIFIYCCN